MSEDIGNKLISFFFTPTSPGKIGTITVDAVLSENASYKSTVTDEPVETGEDISDNIVIHPYTVSLTGVITDSPYDEWGNVLKTNLGDGLSRSKSSYEDLLALYYNKTIFSVVSGFDIYPDMVFTEFTINRDSTSGKAVDFNAEFKHIGKVSPQVVKIPPDNVKDKPPGTKDQTQSTVNKGTQQPKDKDDLHQRSIAAALVDTFRGQLKYSEIPRVIV